MSNTSRTKSSKAPAVKKAVTRKAPVKASVKTGKSAKGTSAGKGASAAKVTKAATTAKVKAVVKKAVTRPAKAAAKPASKPAAKPAPAPAASKVLTPEVLPPEPAAAESDFSLSFQSITLKYCFHGQHSKPESTFRILPGTKQKRRVCSECYTKIMADRRSKVRQFR